MSDRLDALLRQRALLQEHLAWLDSEIAATRPPGTLVAPAGSVGDARTPTLPAPAPARPVALPPLAAPATSTSDVSPTAVAAQADEILESYRTPPTSVKSDVRKGCLLYFVGAFLLLGLGVTALYFLISSRR